MTASFLLAGPNVQTHLRACRPGDFEILHEIDQACYEPEIAYSRAELRDYLRLPGAKCVVAESDGAMVGFCLAARENGYGHIITIDVLQPFRRQGAGTALLAEIERRLVADGAREIWLETATDNEAAIAFWKKHGYRKRGVRKKYYPGNRDAYAMSKRIASPPSAAKSNSSGAH